MNWMFTTLVFVGLKLNVRGYNLRYDVFIWILGLQGLKAVADLGFCQGGRQKKVLISARVLEALAF